MRFVCVSFGHGFQPSSTAKNFLAAFFALATINLSFAQHNAVWVDAVPVTRQLFGAVPETGVNLAVGWNSNIQNNGWRTLAGFAVSSETTDSFGTEVKTNSQNISLRGRGTAGSRLTKRGDRARCRPVWGIDVISRRNHLITRSSNVDFTSDFSTTISNWGCFGSVGRRPHAGPQTAPHHRDPTRRFLPSKRRPYSPTVSEGNSNSPIGGGRPN